MPKYPPLRGFCTFTATTSFGLPAGAIPIRLDPYRHRQPPRFGSAICAVPVLAATEYPGISAQGSATWASIQGTCCRMPISSCAVWGGMRGGGGGRGGGPTRPLAPEPPATTEGVTRTPPLAIVAYTL